MFSVMRKEAWKRGVANELKVEEATKHLAQRTEIDDQYPYMILSMGLTQRLSRRDKAGVDMELVICEREDMSNTTVIPIQIKSSVRSMEEHKKKYPDIECVIVKSGQGTEEIIQSMDRLIRNFFSKES